MPIFAGMTEKVKSLVNSSQVSRSLAIARDEKWSKEPRIKSQEFKNQKTLSFIDSNLHIKHSLIHHSLIHSLAIIHSFTTHSFTHYLRPLPYHLRSTHHILQGGAGFGPLAGFEAAVGVNPQVAGG
jgi:hypothetical protein